MAKRFVEDSSLTTVANAIRSKSGTSAALKFPNGFVSAVNAIQTGGSSGGNSGPFSAAEEFIWTAPAKITDNSGETVIPHSLGVTPDGYHVMALELEYGSEEEYIVNNIIYDPSLIYAEVYRMSIAFGIGPGLSVSALGLNIDTTGNYCTQSDIKFSVGSLNGKQAIPAGKQYRVLVYKR